MVVLTQLDTVLVLWRVKTQVPVRPGGNALQPVNKLISCNFCPEICSPPARLLARSGWRRLSVSVGYLTASGV